jgi:hypothetical protein
MTLEIISYSQYLDLLKSSQAVTSLTLASLTAVIGLPMDLWRSQRPVPPIPPEPAALNGESLGNINGDWGITFATNILGCRFQSQGAGVIMLCDRLVHCAGLTAVSGFDQFPDMPALPRYTSGNGVWMGLTIYATLGTVATDVLITYTNQDGISGRSSIIRFGATSNREVGRMIFVPFQDGDTGVRSVDVVRVNDDTTTAGNFGVTLFRPITTIVTEKAGGNANLNYVEGGLLGLQDLDPDACLFGIGIFGIALAQANGVLLLGA